MILAATMLASCDLGTEQACSEFRFDRQAWVEEDTRQEIADDLARCEVLIGMTRREVRSMLGPPDDVARERGRSSFDYFLGDERGLFVVDGEFLHVGFSPQGRVDDAQIYTG